MLSDQEGHLLNWDTCFCTDKDNCKVLRNFEDTICYTFSPKKLKIVFKISHTNLANLRSQVLEIDVKSSIQDFKLLSGERILILGLNGCVILTDFEGEVLKKFKIDLGRNFKTNTLTVSRDEQYAVVSLFQMSENTPHLILFALFDDSILIKDCVNFKTLLPKTPANNHQDTELSQNNQFQAVTFSNSVLNTHIITAILTHEPKRIYTFCVSNGQLINLGFETAEYVRIKDARSNWSNKVFAVGTNDRLTIVDFVLDQELEKLEVQMRNRPEFQTIQMQSELTSRFKAL